MTKSASVEAAVAALADGTGDPAVLRVAQDEWEAAAAEYASTNAGHKHLSAQAAAADASGDLDTAALLNTVVARGEALRAANRETAALINAVRLAQTEPAAENLPAVATSTSVDIAEPSGPVVPDLSPAQREMWARSLSEFQEMAPSIRSIGNAYPKDVLEGLPKIDTTIGDAESDDADLAQAVHVAAHYRSLRYAYPNWAWNETEKGRAFDVHREEVSRARHERWQKFVQPFVDGLDAQVDRALGHPNAGVKTYEKAQQKTFVTSEELTNRPDVPMAYLKRAIREYSHESAVGAKGWDKAREARFNDNGMALLLAAKDPDSFHRNEALNQVMMAPLDTLSAKDRKWLASNLHKMPGSEENQRVLADSLRSWALGYTDADERRDLGSIMLASNVPSVSAIGRHLLDGDSGVDLVRREPKKKRWFGNGE